MEYWPNISMQNNGDSCEMFASVRLMYWCIYRRFPTETEFKQHDDDEFRLSMIKRILQFYNKKIVANRAPNMQDILGRRKIRMIDLTDDERNISPELTNEDVYTYLDGAK